MIYFDLGCHNGDTVKDFFLGKFNGIDPTGIPCIAYDPLHHYFEVWDKLESEYNVTFKKVAVMDYDGQVDLSIRDIDIKSSVMPDKFKFNEGQIRTVHCVDFSRILSQFVSDVYIRMDIEGAEYLVLRKMIKDGTIKKVKFLEVEWHSQKMNNEKWKKEEDKIVKELRLLGINFKEVR